MADRCSLDSFGLGKAGLYHDATLCHATGIAPETANTALGCSEPEGLLQKIKPLSMEFAP